MIFRVAQFMQSQCCKVHENDSSIVQQVHICPAALRATDIIKIINTQAKIIEIESNRIEFHHVQHELGTVLLGTERVWQVSPQTVALPSRWHTGRDIVE